MPAWRIYYGDGSVYRGASIEDWRRAPDDDVQVVVVDGQPPEPRPDRFKTGYVGCGRTDKTFYTGVDQYDPLGYGLPKAGRLLSDTAYRAIWDLAHGDH